MNRFMHESNKEFLRIDKEKIVKNGRINTEKSLKRRRLASFFVHD